MVQLLAHLSGSIDLQQVDVLNLDGCGNCVLGRKLGRLAPEVVETEGRGPALVVVALFSRIIAI